MARATFLQYRQLVRGANQFYRLLRCDCINGYAVGRKRVARKPIGDLAITVFVNKKLSLRRLPLASRIPQVIRLPDDRASGGVLEFITDVQEARFQSLEYTARQRPSPSGISIGHVAVSAGTLGGLVRDKESSAVAILSNNHVLANSNDASPGDAILQPGAHDGLSVQQTRRTTEHTVGFVDALSATVQVKYDLFQKATFIDQIVVSQSRTDPPFSNGGDSGSLIYDMDARCVGLLFAGSEASGDEPSKTIANPIQHVLRELHVELLTPQSFPSKAERRGQGARRPRARTKRTKKAAGRR